MALREGRGFGRALFLLRPATGKLDARTDPVHRDQSVVFGIAVRRANSPPDRFLILVTLQKSASNCAWFISVSPSFTAGPVKLCSSSRL